MESSQPEEARVCLTVALNALQTISRNDMNEISALRVPTPVVCSIIQAIAILHGVISKVDGTTETSWEAVKSILRPVPEFLDKLKTFHLNNPRIQINVRNAVLNTLGSGLTEATVRSHSMACAALFVWIQNLMKYYELCEN